MPEEEFREVPLDRLRPDPENSRLPMEDNWSSEAQFLREFYLRYNLIELARSIADKGFTPRHTEALLAIEDPSEPERYIVVEGNRRLAALKLLTSAENRKTAGVRGPEWESLALQANFLDSQSIPVIVYPSKEDLNSYIGFRHITGPSPWRPEAKARFIAKLLGEGQSVGETARRIGSNHRTVRRYAEAHAIYMQALSSDIPLNGVEAGFGVFYNALDWKGVRGFLKLGLQTEINQLPVEPVPVDSLGRLRELIGLLYGDSTRNLKPAIRESRDLSKLSQVLGDEVSTANLQRDRDLERAWRVSGGGKTELLGILEDLHLRLAVVNGQAREYSDDENIRRGVRRIRDLMKDMADRYRVSDS